MMPDTCILLLLLTVFTVPAYCELCDGDKISSNGTVNRNFTRFGVCTFNVTITPPRTFVLKNLMLTEGDIFWIADANISAMVNYTSKDKVPFEVVVGLDQYSTVVYFYAKPDVSRSNWTLEIKESCSVSIDNEMTTLLTSPKYVNKMGEMLNCTYKVANNLPTDTIAAVTVLNLEVDTSSNVNISSSGSSDGFSYPNKPPYPDFFASTSDIDVQFYFDANGSQSFIMLVEPVLKGCSGNVKLENRMDLFGNLYTLKAGSPYICRKLVTAIQSVTLQVHNLDISAGLDSLTLRDGVSSRSTVLKSFYNPTEQESWFISSGKSVVVNLILESPKNISLTAIPDVGQKNGNLTIKKDNKELYWHLTADGGKQVKVNFPSLENMIVTFYNGSQPSDPVLTVLNNDRKYLNPVYGGPEVLIYIQPLNLTADTNATFTSEDKDCNHLATGPSSQWSVKAPKSFGTCTCFVFPNNYDQAQQLVLYLDNIQLIGNDSFTVKSGQNNSQILAQFTNTSSQYQVIGSTKEGLRLEFTTSINSTSQVSLHYATVPSVCGGDIRTDNAKYNVLTPNYPNQYPLNAMCTWAVSTAVKKKLWLSFDEFNLVAEHSLSIIAKDTVKFNKANVPKANLLVDANNTKVEFNSEGSSPASGYGVKLTYQTFDCGDSYDVTNTTTIASQYAECVWIVRMSNQNALVNLTVNPADSDTRKNLNETLIIYDGPTMQSHLLMYKLSTYELSTSDTVVIYLKSSALKLNFTVLVESYNCTLFCENKKCMHPDWMCNGINNCGDNTDELYIFCSNTTTPTPIPTTTVKPEAADYSGWVKAGWVPACLFIGIILGLIFYFAVPKIIRKIRGRGGDYSRMGDDRPVVT